MSNTNVSRKSRVVIAGQIPPPFGGQNVMIARFLKSLREDASLQVLHLSFSFSPELKKMRTGSLGKLVELLRVILRLVKLRWGGPLDLLIYPTGGPQTVPIIRDILLLPFILLFSRKTVLHFHAAGIADRMASRKGLLFTLLSSLYKKVDGAIVMTTFNRRDPDLFSIAPVFIIPHRLNDKFNTALLHRDPAGIRLLYMGHLCADKGTPELLQAFAKLQLRYPSLQLELVGEPLPPYSLAKIQSEICASGLASRIFLSGLLTGTAKAAALGRANLFVFPSVAPYESFGLVMIEAMMWGLPIVASHWRGNAEVLGENFGGLLYQPYPNHSTALAAAIEFALQLKDRWSQWERVNRKIFLQRYHRHSDADNLGDTIHGLLATSTSS